MSGCTERILSSSEQGRAMKYQPGDRVKIKINGEEIETRIDDRGTQRLPCDNQLARLMEGQYNFLTVMVQLGYISKKAKRKIYQNVGYSVCGYAEIFPKDEIENPVWDEK